MFICRVFNHQSTKHFFGKVKRKKILTDYKGKEKKKDHSSDFRHLVSRHGH